MLDAVSTSPRDLPAGPQRAVAMKRLSMLVAGTLSLAGCATNERLNAQDTRSENVDHQRLQVRRDGSGTGAVEAYALRPTEGYRMPQLHTAPPPVLGSADPRQELPPTKVCLQLVVDAEGRVERSLPLADRPECEAGTAAINLPLLQAAQQAVAMWRFSPAALCHFPAGSAPRDATDCDGAERIEPVPVSLLYAFTFEIVKGRHYVRSETGG